MSLALGVLGLVWFFIAPAVGFVLRMPFGLNMYDIWPLITLSALVCGFVGGHILEAAGLPTRKAAAGIVLGFVGLPFSLVVAGYFLFIRFVVFPAT
ncbi:MAG TPA: hypothetical protein VFT74_15790 [Isosphaeraceae bacterium]|nr:hypothetical protein [Isosphaeraceae bacterium]